MVRRDVWRYIAIAVGAFGACGQALLLYHDLADCYPYKMMRYPSGQFYASVGRIGLFVAPIVAIYVARFVSRRSLASAPAVATLVSPAAFLAVFFLAHVVTGVDWGNTENFDFNTASMLLGEFTRSVAQLAFAGAVVGSGCGTLIWGLSRLVGAHHTDPKSHRHSSFGSELERP